MRSWLAVGLGMLLVACGGAQGGPDGGPPDAGGSSDAGPADAGALDAGPSGGDGGPLDGGAADAGQLDAGPPDGGPFDAGVPDAGPPDAGVPDAGPSDAGCRQDSECTSGLCLPSQDCASCQSDLECAAGLCGTGACQPACSGPGDCAAGFDCCGGRCLDLSRDPDHCGQCATACAPSDFCGLGQCRSPVVAAACLQSRAWILYDGEAADDAAGPLMAGALAARCGFPTPVPGSGQTDGGVLDPATGQPLLVGAVLVTAGGSFRQRALDWLERTGRAPITGPTSWTVFEYTLADGGVVASFDPATITPGHDAFVVQLVRTPTGSVVLNAAGMYGPGTSAAAWYFANVMLPTLGALDQQWYVVEWRDDGDGAPGTSDTWTVLGSGS